ncbi:MAG: hypothetical protein J5685_01875 [Clostridiales bacterium]|nr:hypothetical protein [Clostridiales bacterium]
MDSIKWLASHYGTDEGSMKEVLKTERATTYLLIWPVFEQELFGGFMMCKDIPAKATEYQTLVTSDHIDEMAIHFHKRYKDSENKRHLLHDQKNNPLFDSIINKEYDDLSIEDKVVLLLFVSYRYRNNIFHGNKNVRTWKNYTTEIDYCLDFMMMLLDSYTRGKVVGPDE